jgi:hypothetical protein
MTHEKEVRAANGWLMLFIVLALYVFSTYLLIDAIRGGETNPGFAPKMIGFAGAMIVASIFCGGFFIVEPNGRMAAKCCCSLEITKAQ